MALARQTIETGVVSDDEGEEYYNPKKKPKGRHLFSSEEYSIWQDRGMKQLTNQDLHRYGLIARSRHFTIELFYHDKGDERANWSLSELCRLSREVKLLTKKNQNYTIDDLVNRHHPFRAKVEVYDHVIMLYLAGAMGLGLETLSKLILSKSGKVNWDDFCAAADPAMRMKLQKPEDELLANTSNELRVDSWKSIKYDVFRHFEEFCQLYNAMTSIGNITAFDTYFFDYKCVQTLKKKISVHVAKEQQAAKRETT